MVHNFLEHGMTESFGNKKTYLDRIANHLYINEIIFFGLVILCFVGDILGEVSDHASIVFWLLLVPIFFLSSLIVEKSQLSKQKKLVKTNIGLILVLWASAFFSILLVLFLWHSGILLVTSIGLIIHIILAHTVFISGIILGLRFYLIGIFLFILAGLTIAMEGVVGMTLLLFITVLIIGYYFKRPSSAARVLYQHGFD